MEGFNQYDLFCHFFDIITQTVFSDIQSLECTVCLEITKHYDFVDF